MTFDSFMVIFTFFVTRSNQKVLIMSVILCLTWLITLQHYPPPPSPPIGFDLHSFIVTDSFGDNTDYGDNKNGLFRRLVFGEEILGDNLSGFCDVWENIGGRITALNRNNWRQVIRYVRDLGPQNCASGEVTLGIACNRARDEGGQNYNSSVWCGGSYDLPIRVELSLILILSFVFIHFKRYSISHKGLSI